MIAARCPQGNANLTRAWIWNRPLFDQQLLIAAVRRDDEVVVYFDLPGADADTIDLTVDAKQLTLKAERSFEPAEGDEVIASERTNGSVSRTLHLGDNLDALDLDTVLPFFAGPIFISLDSAFPDLFEPTPPANCGTAAASGFSGADVLVTFPGVAPVLLRRSKARPSASV